MAKSINECLSIAKNNTGIKMLKVKDGDALVYNSMDPDQTVPPSMQMGYPDQQHAQGSIIANTINDSNELINAVVDLYNNETANKLKPVVDAIEESEGVEEATDELSETTTSQSNISSEYYGDLQLISKSAIDDLITKGESLELLKDYFLSSSGCCLVKLISFISFYLVAYTQKYNSIIDKETYEESYQAFYKYISTELDKAENDESSIINIINDTKAKINNTINGLKDDVKLIDAVVSTSTFFQDLTGQIWDNLQNLSSSPLLTLLENLVKLVIMGAIFGQTSIVEEALDGQFDNYVNEILDPVDKGLGKLHKELSRFRYIYANFFGNLNYTDKIKNNVYKKISDSFTQVISLQKLGEQLTNINESTFEKITTNLEIIMKNIVYNDIKLYKPIKNVYSDALNFQRQFTKLLTESPYGNIKDNAVLELLKAIGIEQTTTTSQIYIQTKTLVSPIISFNLGDLNFTTLWNQNVNEYNKFVNHNDYPAENLTPIVYYAALVQYVAFIFKSIEITSSFTDVWKGYKAWIIEKYPTEDISDINKLNLHNMMQQMGEIVDQYTAQISDEASVEYQAKCGEMFTLLYEMTLFIDPVTYVYVIEELQSRILEILYAWIFSLYYEITSPMLDFYLNPKSIELNLSKLIDDIQKLINTWFDLLPDTYKNMKECILSTNFNSLKLTDQEKELLQEFPVLSKWIVNLKEQLDKLTGSL